MRDDEGSFWIPAGAIGNPVDIGNLVMRPGRGYQVFTRVNEALGFAYPSELAILGVSLASVQQASHFLVTIPSSGVYHTITFGAATIGDIPLEVGQDEIAVFDGDNLVGAGIWQGDNQTGISAIMSITPPVGEPTPGAVQGHTMLYRIWDASRGVEVSAAADPVLTFRENGFDWNVNLTGAPPSGPAISIPDTTARPGQILLIPVAMNTTIPTMVSSAEMSITYDSDVIRALEPSTMGTLSEHWLVQYQVSQSAGVSIDTIHIRLATSVDTVSSDTLVYIRARVSEYASPGDSSALTFEECEFNEGAISVQTEGGMLRIVSMLGDVSGNGHISAYDASLILQEVVGLITLPDPQWPAFTLATADVTGNGSISGLDASWILRYVAGIITQFPLGTDGDVEKIAYAEKKVCLGDVGQLSRHRWIVPIEIDEMDAVLAGEMVLSFDGGVVEEVRITGLLAGYLSAVNIGEGYIRLVFAGAESPSGGGRIAEVILEGTPVLSIDRVNLNEGKIPVHIVGGETGTPRAYSLSQNYPNPFNSETTIQYDLPECSTVLLSVYALKGQLMRTLVHGECSAGSHFVTWDGKDKAGRDVASGVYLCRMKAGTYSAVRKLVLVR